MKKLGIAAMALLAMTAGASAQITINELLVDQTGTDNDEFFELAGPAGASLNDLTYLVIGDGTGASGVIESVTSLAGLSIPADGYFVAVEPSFTPFPIANADLVTAANALNFENTDNVTHVLVSGFTGSNGQDLDTNDDGILDLTPWTSVIDNIGLLLIAQGAPPGPAPAPTEWAYLGNYIGPEGTFAPGSVYRFPNSNGPWNINPFASLPGSTTPGVANVPEPTTVALLGLGGLLLRRRKA